jgi:hypothetical protein
VSKKIFITSFHPLVSRNILSSGILDKLNSSGFKVVILVPREKKDFFEKSFANEGVVVEGVVFKSGRREAFFRYISFACLRTETLKIKRKTEMGGSGAISSLFFANRIGVGLLRFLEKITYKHDIFGTLFEKYKPEKVFSTDMQSELDIALIHEAKKRNIKTVGMIRSWDNLTSKGLIRVIPGKLLVWNEIVRTEAQKYHYIKDPLISIVGIVHYDSYKDLKETSREDFIKKIGGDVSKKTALLVPIGDRYLKENTVDRDIVKILSEILPLNFQILVRLPPGDFVRELENKENKFERIKVLFDRATKNFENIKMTEIGKQDDEHLVNTLRNVDIVISGPSTMAIDSVVFDKPTVLFGFDGYQKRPYLDSIRRYYDYDNFVPVIESGGVRLAKSVEEFKELVNSAINNPSKDHDFRMCLVDMEASVFYGKCLERLMDALK